MKKLTFLILVGLNLSCSSSESGRRGGAASADFNCDGQCSAQSLTQTEVQSILRQAVLGARQLNAAATVAVLDRVGNLLGLYQMSRANLTTTINGQIGAQGGLEGQSIASSLAAISKAGTGAYLSSQGQAFSTRTASQIIQEHFNPGELKQTAGPLFGVQFSSLPCSDITTRNPTFADILRLSGAKPSFSGNIGPRFLPLGLSGDPGGLPLYKNGDLVGGIGVEMDATYRLDRNIQNFDDDIEERIALYGSIGFEAPSKRIASQINVGKSLRFTDLGFEDLASLIDDGTTLDPAGFIAVTEFTDGTTRAGVAYGSAESGVLKTTRVNLSASILVTAAATNRYPSIAGTPLPDSRELSISEVDALLDSALIVAHKTRAAIRRPLDSYAQVSVWIVDQLGTPLGLVRTEDAPLFGIDVALQKARTAAFFSSSDAASVLSAAGFTDYLTKAQALIGASAFTGQSAISARAIGNLARPFFPDGIDSTDFGPLSLTFPYDTSLTQTWSPFNTGLQLAIIQDQIFAGLGVGANFPETCGQGGLAGRLGGGIQIFPGAVPLYRGTTLIGGIGVSGDGVDQDDLIAFYSATRKALDEANHTNIGDATLGFNAPVEIRSDRLALSREGVRLRYVNCPEAPFVGSNEQNICGGR